MPKNKNAFIRYRLIDAALRNRQKKYPSKTELIEACKSIGNVSLRTIEKDLYDMQYDEELGYFAPILYHPTQKGYYYSDENYSINKLPLKKEDIYAIEFACSLLKQFESIEPIKQFIDSVSKIEEYINIQPDKHQTDWSKRIQTENVWNADNSRFLSPLLKAINEQQEVMMHYQRFGNTQVKHYRFQPYVLKEYRNRWYVTGYAVTEKSIRTFALERIKDLIQTHEHFDLSFDFNPEEYFRYSFGISVINGYMPEDIELSFSSKQAAYIKSKPWHHTQKILKDNDEEFRISMQVIPSYELREQILAYGDEVKVIKPLSLKKLISDTLHQAAKNYKV